MRKLHRLCRRLLAVLALLLVAYACIRLWRRLASLRDSAGGEWEPLPGGPESPDDGCRLRSERARYAVDRAAGPNCRRDLLRAACAFEAGRLPYRRTGDLGQACPVRLQPGLAAVNESSACHRLLPGCPYPTAAMAAAGAADCVGRCRAAGYLVAATVIGDGGDCVCLQLLGGVCTEEAGCPASAPTSAPASALYRVSATGLNPAAVLVSHAAPAYSADLQGKSWENDRVRLVYLLVLSGRGVRQVHRLLSALYYVNHYYYIHVDVRDSYLHESLLPLEARFPNVRLMRRRFPTIWGGTGLLDLMLTAFQELLDSDWHWDYVINLSESDFPIRPNWELTAYLTEMRHLSFLASHSGNYSEFMRKQAIGRYFAQCDNHMYFLGDRDPIDNILFDGGSDWLTLNREFVQFVMRSLQSDLIGNIVRYFKYGLLPVESVFHTIAQNSELCGSVANANLRLVNWDRKRGCRCQHLLVADWCGCSPMVFNGAEAAVAAAGAASAGSSFFARKFDPTISVAAIDSVVGRLLSRPDRRPRHGRPRYWQSGFNWLLDTELTGHQRTVGRLLVRLLEAELGLVSVGGGGGSGPCVAGAGVEPLEVTDFYLEDSYQGLILTASIGGAAGQAAAAAAAVVDAHFSVRSASVSTRIVTGAAVPGSSSTKSVNASSPASSAAPVSVVAARYREFEVGRHYDWKEGIFRDRLGLLPPGAPSATGLQLRYAWGPGPAVSATFLLLDPDGAIRSAFQLNVPATPASPSTASTRDDDGDVGCADLQAPGSLRPGVWRLLLLDERQPVASAIAQCEFVLLPALHDAASGWLAPGTREFASANHYADEVKPDPQSPQYLALFRSVPPDVVAGLRAANGGGGDSSAGTEAWFARVVLGRRYSVEAVCRHAAAAAAAACPGLVGLTDLCSSADWSTRFADPRYSLGSLDPLSGYL